MPREYKCGICHQPGHNRNTCTAAAGEQESLCSNCGGSGHNVRTCAVSPKIDLASCDKAKEMNSPVVPRKCSYCDKPGHYVSTCDTKKKDQERSKVKHCSTCGKEGHNRRTCVILATREKKVEAPENPPVALVAPARPKIVEVSISDLKGKQQRRNLSTNSIPVIPEKILQFLELPHKYLSDGKDITSLKEIILEKLKDQYDEMVEVIKPKIESEPTVPKCSNCKTPGHYVKTCPDLEALRQEKSSQTDYAWLSKNAQLLLENGPHDNHKFEGPGYIYMYKEAGTTQDNDKEETYKIGRTIHLPHRRVKAQASSNQAEYVIIKTFDTPYNQLTEKVIHAHLHDLGRRRRKPEGDGKTEWFMGSKDELVEIVTKVLREVNGMYQ